MPSEITRILQRTRTDSDAALAELLPLVYNELGDMAAAYLKRERKDHTLQPTALIHEVFLRMVDAPSTEWTDRAHFFAAAAQAMRRILVDHARRRSAAKRKGRDRVTLSGDLASSDESVVDVLDLNGALDELTELHGRKARVVELRFFGGMTFEEAAHVLGVSPKTVEADWYMARAWLRRALTAEAS